MKDEFLININIADREYPIKIKRNEPDSEQREAVIRSAAKRLNDTILQLKERNYKNKDEYDFLAMTSLHFVSKLIEMEENKDIEPLLKKVQELDQMLNDFIES